MRLRDWYRTRTVADRVKAATAIGISPHYLRSLAEKHRDPSPKVALKLERYTTGVLSRHELLPDVYPFSGCTCDNCLHRQEQQTYATVLEDSHAP